MTAAYQRIATDEELVREALAHPDRYATLVERYEKKLARYIRRVVPLSEDDIKDVLQDVFIKAYQNLNDFDGSLLFSSWIYRIAHNEAITLIRKRKHLVRFAPSSEIDDDELDAGVVEAIAADDDVEEEVGRRLQSEQAQHLLNELDPLYRTVLVLRFVEQKDYHEISDIMRKPMGTVATLLYRAKKQFRQKAGSYQWNLSA
jgi:RNA polymerase sigma-70 factor (ECF subfamily)